MIRRRAESRSGVDSLYGYARFLYRNTDRVRGYTTDSVIVGPCAGGPVYSPALTRFVFLEKVCQNVFLRTGSDQSVTGEEVSAEP